MHPKEDPSSLEAPTRPKATTQSNTLQKTHKSTPNNPYKPNTTPTNPTKTIQTPHNRTPKISLAQPQQTPSLAAIERAQFQTTFSLSSSCIPASFAFNFGSSIEHTGGGATSFFLRVPTSKQSIAASKLWFRVPSLNHPRNQV
jgi:hypothetical protein